MERLTSNKPVNEMSMVELAHNSCYAKDRLARYRDFEMDMDARDFARNLMTTLTDDELPLDDDNFDEEILENLIYDPFSDVKGLIALFYRNLWAMADLREKLKSYEDAEEQGLLLRLNSKDELIEVLARKLLNEQFGVCYMCKNPMKNITLDGVNNGCDGGCNLSEERTVDDFLKKIVRELEYMKQKEAEQELKKLRAK